jgi:hypothetical protein
MGNGSYASGDGWTYRGGGGLHHTGKAEYDRILKTHGFTPDQIRNPVNTAAIFAAACSYFKVRDVIEPAKARDDERVTRRINGGLIGHADRMVLVRRYEAALMGWKLPAARTRTETMQRSQKQAGAALATGPATTAASATIASQQPAQAQQSDAAFWIGAGVVLAVAVIMGFGVSRLIRAARLKSELEIEAAAKGNMR